tara:strand:- start:209 stop:1414 length:1206 start_codon:yes stop_codon:yes gene_type:complete
MTPEEILEKIGLNGKILKKFALGKLLTDADATHASVIVDDVEKFLKSLDMPIDLITDIQEPLLFELKSMVPESMTFKQILRKKDSFGSDIVNFQNKFNNLVKAHLRMPLSMDTVKKLTEGTNDFETAFDLIKDAREPGVQGLSDVAEQFDDFQIGIFNEKFNSFETLDDYIKTNVGELSKFVDDLELPEGFRGGDIAPPGMSFMGTDTPPIEKLIKGPFDDLIQFTAAQELGNIIDPELAAKAARVLESSKEVGEQIFNSAQKFTKDAIRVTGKAAGALDPGDVAIRTAVPKLLATLGIGSISSAALTLYAVYEGALLLADAVDGIEEAVTNMEDNESIKDFGKDFWKGFTEDSLSEKYSLSYKLTEPIHNRLFNNVYDTMAETPKTPVSAGGGGGRVRIL